MTRHRALWIVILLLGSAHPPAGGPRVAAASQAQAAAPAAPELAGLWRARRWFGPFARGPLLLRRTDGELVADMMGRTLPVRSSGKELSFELPNGQGAFRGRLETGGAIQGHWFPPNSVTQNFQYASPVRLQPSGPGRWRGEVVPFEDEFTLYLLLRRRPDGTLSALLRNPQRDYGAWLGVEEIMINQSEEPDYYRFTLKVPMATDPGEKAVYCSSNPNLALGVLGRAAGESPLDLFDRLLGVPMKIDRYGWGLDPAGHPYGGGSVQFRPRDFLKFGQLMLDGGTWHGRRLLSREFVARASAPLYHLRGIFHGYLWWGIDYPYKDRTVHAFFAGGAGGQGVTVIPELDLVIANFAGNYSSKGSIHTQQNLIPRYLLPAVREPGDDPRAPVKPREDYVTPYGPSKESGRVARRGP